MKRVLVLGAGHSTPYLIRHLLEEGSELEVVVADRDLQAAEARVEGASNGRAEAVDASDLPRLTQLIEQAEVVVNFLAPRFQAPVAELCLAVKRSMVSASYRSPELLALGESAEAAGLTFASELGLDPGLDHLSAVQLLDGLKAQGHRIEVFESYGSGISDPDTFPNPLGYAVTWNPRNVVMAGEGGARFLDQARPAFIPYPDVFRRTWAVEVPGVGSLEAYANRNSEQYLDLYGLRGVDRLVRGTLRAPGFCETWSAIARLGLPNERAGIEDLADWTWRELVESHLDRSLFGSIQDRVARQLNIHPGSQALRNMAWLGLFADDLLVGRFAPGARTPAEALGGLMSHRLALPADGRDLVILHHLVRSRAPSPNGEIFVSTSTMVERGAPGGGLTAMARTVGLPAALTTLEILGGRFPVVGTPIPTDPRVVAALLPLIEQAGLQFVHEGPFKLEPR